MTGFSEKQLEETIFKKTIALFSLSLKYIVGKVKGQGGEQGRIPNLEIKN